MSADPPVHVLHVVRSGRWADCPRPGVPLLGAFLLVLGAILLADAVTPGTADLLFAAVGVAAGGALLASWARGGSGLYPGFLLEALFLPGLLVALGLLPDRHGYGTLLLGAGLLVVSASRWREGRGPGWQGVIGLVLAILGGAAVSGYPGASDLAWAAILIAVGAWILLARRRPAVR